jgi:hypothetical protein
MHVPDGRRGVQLAGTHVRHEDVPVLVRAVGRWIELNNARSFRVVDRIEQLQLDAGGVPPSTR